MSVARRFPMQGPSVDSIDWRTAEAIYEMYSALYGTQQSLERLAERGGFGWAEVEYIGREYRRRFKKAPPATRIEDGRIDV